MLSRLRRPLVVLAAGAVLVGGLGLADPASAKVPRAPRTFTSSIEGYTPYVGQDDCDPTAKRGTRMLGNLLTRTYRGTIAYYTRPCVAGSTSEHYDGRAIDWMVSVKNRAQHRMGHAFWTWLLASDKFGDRHAMARRLGVMYIIYNNRQWGFWSHHWEDYNGCTAKRMQAAKYDNACHRTHMHISLSWNGARAKTTFWTGRVYATDYGPCRKRGHTYAPKWTKPNRDGCGR
jgi:hypothetical protein